MIRLIWYKPSRSRYSGSYSFTVDVRELFCVFSVVSRTALIGIVNGIGSAPILSEIAGTSSYGMASMTWCIGNERSKVIAQRCVFSANIVPKMLNAAGHRPLRVVDGSETD